MSDMIKNDLLYVFKVEVKRLNILEFTADFTGSENISLLGEEEHGLKTFTVI